MSEVARYLDTPIGPYRLRRLLGVGPVSRVYLAERQNEAGHQIALKFFETVPLLKQEEKDQTLSEVRLLACMEHPGILPLLDDGLHEHMLFLVTPYVHGSSLRQRLTASAGDPLPLDEVLSIARQVGDALQFAHTQQIIHANLKPENIFLQENGPVLLADFLLPSLAQSERAARILSTFAALYMAPEQFQGIATPLSDQYALACLLYELLTGQPPFRADDGMSLARQHASREPLPPSQFQPACAGQIDRAILRALVKKPEGRYPDMQDFLSDLDPTYVPSEILPSDITSITIDPAVPLVIEDEVEEPGMQVLTEMETVKQPLIEVLPLVRGNGPRSVMTGFYEAVTQAMCGVRPKPGQQGQELGKGDVNPNGTPLLAPPGPGRRPAPLSRRQIWLTLFLLALLMGLGIFGVAFVLNGNGSHHQSQSTAVARNSATASTSQPLPGRTSTVASIVISQTPAAQPSQPATPGDGTAQAETTATPGSGSPTPTPTATAVPALSCNIQYTVSQQWPGGFTASLKVTNTGSKTIQGWNISFTFLDGQQISSSWAANFSQKGTQATLASMSYNSTIAPGASATPGFQGTWQGQNRAPTAFAVNGVPCH